MADYYKLISVFAAVTLVGYLYDKYNARRQREAHSNHYDIVRKHLLGEKTLHLEPHKPTIWVHLDHEVNDRAWASFGSRNSSDINYPFVVAALTTLVDRCAADFNVCFLNDESFRHLVPYWEVDISRLTGGTRDLARTLALTKVLHKYGGMVVPCGALVGRSLLPMYEEMTAGGRGSSADMFACELPVANSLHRKLRTFISHKCMGCAPRSKAMKRYSDEVAHLMSRDYTSESAFTGELDRLLHRAATEGAVRLVNGRVVGVLDERDDVVTVERLFSHTPVPFDFGRMVMLLVDVEAIARRGKYEWFARLERDALLDMGVVVTEIMRMYQGGLV